MKSDTKAMTRKSLFRTAAMVAILAPAAMLAGCAQEPPPPAPMQVAPPAPPPAPAPVPRARG